MRRDPRVQLALPVDALTDRLDHQIALGEPRQVGVVVRSVDPLRDVVSRERCGLELRERVDRVLRKRIRTRGRCEVEQQRRDAGIGEVRGDLRAHDAGAENGGAAYGQHFGHQNE